MQIDWRGLLTTIRVPWVDRGANTSGGNVNIACPWCRNDPSHHLGISLHKEAFYCYREPNRHSGSSFIRLLVALRQPRVEAVRLLNQHRERVSAFVPTEPADPAKVRAAWDRFAPAAASTRCLNYLERRGFASPRTVAETYDLRVAPAGDWSGRILLPLHGSEGEPVSWTGRALSPELTPKYLVQQLQGSYLFKPDARKPIRHTLVLVEGPLDALKIANACRRAPYIVAALSGKHLGSGKLLQLRLLGAERVLLAADADVSTSSVYQQIAELSQALRPRHIGRAKIPTGYKDPAEIPTEEILPWLVASSSQLK